MRVFSTTVACEQAVLGVGDGGGGGGCALLSRPTPSPFPRELALQACRILGLRIHFSLDANYICFSKVNC